MSTEEAEKKLAEVVLAEQKLELPVPAKSPFDARLKSKKRQKFCDFLAFW